MAAVGYSIAGIVDIPANSSEENVIKDKPGQVLREASKVDIYLTREAVSVNATVTVGGTIVFPAGPVNVNATVGTLPSTQDDKVISTIAAAGDSIIVAGDNLTAGALELRALVKVTPLSSMALQGGRSN